MCGGGSEAVVGWAGLLARPGLRLAADRRRGRWVLDRGVCRYVAGPAVRGFLARRPWPKRQRALGAGRSPGAPADQRRGGSGGRRERWATGGGWTVWHPEAAHSRRGGLFGWLGVGDCGRLTVGRDEHGQGAEEATRSGGGWGGRGRRGAARRRLRMRDGGGGEGVSSRAAGGLGGCVGAPFSGRAPPCLARPAPKLFAGAAARAGPGFQALHGGCREGRRANEEARCCAARARRAVFPPWAVYNGSNADRIQAARLGRGGGWRADGADVRRRRRRRRAAFRAVWPRAGRGAKERVWVGKRTN